MRTHIFAPVHLQHVPGQTRLSLDEAAIERHQSAARLQKSMSQTEQIDCFCIIEAMHEPVGEYEVVAGRFIDRDIFERLANEPSPGAEPCDGSADVLFADVDAYVVYISQIGNNVAGTAANVQNAAAPLRADVVRDVDGTIVFADHAHETAVNVRRGQDSTHVQGHRDHHFLSARTKPPTSYF